MSQQPQKTIPINLCEPGQVLASDVHNEKGQKVVSGDTELTAKLIKRLVGSGVSRVDVYGEREREEVSRNDEEEATPEVASGPETREEDGRVVIDEDLHENFVGESDVTLDGDIDRGAVLTARGDVEVLGAIRDGTVRAMSGEIEVTGDINSGGETVQLISSQPILVTSVINSKVSVRGDLVVDDCIRDSVVECLGNLVVHGDDAQANIAGSSLEVQGKVMADRVQSSRDQPNDFSFRDPEVVNLNRKRSKKQSTIEDLKQEAEKLKNLVDTVKELGDQVKSLPPEKQEKIKKRTEKYESVQKRINRASSTIDDIDEQLEELRDERRYFMRVLDLLQAETTISFEESNLTVDEDEENVRLYKKGMIVIQDASDIPFEPSEWLAN